MGSGVMHVAKHIEGSYLAANAIQYYGNWIEPV